jgi:hypothetical protein
MKKVLFSFITLILASLLVYGQFEFTVPAAVTVTTAGTRVQLTSTTGHDFARMLYIEADEDNTGVLYVGDVGVSSTEYAAALAAGEGFSVTMSPPDTFDATDIYLDVSVNGEIASYSIIF